MSSVVSRTRHNISFLHHCDDPGLDVTLRGVVVGGAVGAGLGAALPGFESHCSFMQLFGLSFWWPSRFFPFPVPRSPSSDADLF